ncbi:unnamed protein product [Blepharisma stoltei]|uniref:Uncharacterized protein n=1 Tax=Blepharisma stoltei TaxID=1481888 RepID=A0AAU9IIS9_9CILI|nr:unnamed protein product [Blepharisma stoltei]
MEIIQILTKNSYGFSKQLPQKIFYILERNRTTESFVDKTLPNVLNWASYQSNNLLSYLQIIIDDARFELEEKETAEKLANALNALIEVFGSEPVLREFSIYSKGVGVFIDKIS